MTIQQGPPQADEYEDWINTLLGELAKEHATDGEVTIEMCVNGIQPNHPATKRLRDYVVKTLKFKASDFDKALRARVIKDRFGAYPETAEDFVYLMAREMKLTVLYNGKIKQNPIPYTDRVLIDVDEEINGNCFAQRHAMTPSQLEDPLLKRYADNRFKSDLPFFEFRRKTRIQATAYSLPWTSPAINDACDQWYDDMKTNRLWKLFEDIALTDSMATRERGKADLKRLVEACFDDPEGADFVIAILEKFIWQVKRKMTRMEITNHLFAVLLGVIQGSGKSTLLRKFISPVAEAAIPADFRAIADEKIIAIWRNYVMYMDEMGWASKSNIETIRNVVTASSVLRRPMTTNNAEDIAQNSTFIGTDNAQDISEIIRDTAGIRRFIGLKCKNQLDWDVVNDVDFVAIWQSVDHEAADPTVPFMDRLRVRQEQDRLKTNVEEWAAQYQPSYSTARDSRVFTSGDLFTDFRTYEDKFFPGDRTNIIVFGRQLAKMRTSPFEKMARHGTWRWIGDKDTSPEGVNSNVTNLR